MAKLSDVVNTLETGDVVVTYYPEQPPPSRQLLHLTMILRAAHSGGAGDCFAHSDNTANEVHRSPFADYAKLGGFLVAKCVDTEQAKRAANAARIWSSTLTKTPYGQSPMTEDMKTPDVKVKLAASRFIGMKDTASLAEIPFDAAALARLLKWTLRLKESAPLSKRRGVTCAAFLAECHQAAAMLNHITTTIGPHALDAALVGKVDALFESKDDLRKSLDLVRVELKDDATSGKDHAFVGQAKRDNSNRTLTTTAQSRLPTARTKFATKQSKYSNYLNRGLNFATLSEVELLWVIIQNELKISTYSMLPLDEIIPAEFLLDAKYVNSRLMTTILKTSQNWLTTPYDAY